MQRDAGENGQGIVQADTVTVRRPGDAIAHNRAVVVERQRVGFVPPPSMPRMIIIRLCITRIDPC